MNLQDKIPYSVIRVVKRLQENGFQAYIVGGSIRNLLLKLPVRDFDIATNATPTQITPLFSRVIPTGLKYGTVSVKYRQKLIEITTYRQESNYDGRRPHNIKFIDYLITDLGRRDFTINAIAYNPITNELVDPFNGQNDLMNHLIRAVGDPIERYKEDNLRMFRAIRLASELNFDIENNTFSAIQPDKFKMQLSMERIRDELIKIMSGINPKKGFELLTKSKLLPFMFPQLSTIENHSDYGKLFLKQLIYKCQKSSPGRRWAVLLDWPHNQGDERTKLLLHDISWDPLTILRFLKFPKTIKQKILTQLESRNRRRKGILNTRELSINGHDLIELKFIESREFSGIFKDIIFQIQQKKIKNTKNSLLEYVKKRYTSF